MRSPEGAMMIMQQQQEVARTGQKVAERQQMIQPIPLGDTGQFVIPLTGQVFNPETGDQRQMSMAEADSLGLELESVQNGVMKFVRKGARNSQPDRPFQFLKGEPLAGGEMSPDRWSDPYTGKVWNANDPVPEEVKAARRNAAPATNGGGDVAAAKPTYNPFD